jgi:hypothetical protein
MRKRREASVGWGALVVVGTPLALFILMFSVIGAPVAVLIGALWVFALITSAGLAGVALGSLLLHQGDKTRGDLALAALAGIPIVMILGWLPFVGFLVNFVVAAWVLGGIVLTLYKARSLA